MVTVTEPGPARVSAPSPCPHRPSCPAADATDHGAARVVASYPEQGWSRLCNGVIVFDDTGELMPDGRPVPPCRGPARHAAAGTLSTSLT
jgi:hypothetical protein